MDEFHNTKKIIADADPFDLLSVEEQRILGIDNDRMEEMPNEQRLLDDGNAVVLEQNQIELRTIVDQRTRKCGQIGGVESSTAFE